MRLVEVNTLPSNKQVSVWDEILASFIDSDINIALVDGYKPEHYPGNVISALNARIKKHGYKDVKAIQRNNEVYLCKTYLGFPIVGECS